MQRLGRVSACGKCVYIRNCHSYIHTHMYTNVEVNYSLSRRAMCVQLPGWTKKW